MTLAQRGLTPNKLLLSAQGLSVCLSVGNSSSAQDTGVATRTPPVCFAAQAAMTNLQCKPDVLSMPLNTSHVCLPPNSFKSKRLS